MTPLTGWPSTRSFAGPGHRAVDCRRDDGDAAPRPVGGPSTPSPFWRYLERMNLRNAAPTTADVFAKVGAREAIAAYSALERRGVGSADQPPSAGATGLPRAAHASPRIGDVSEPERVERRVSVDLRVEHRVRAAVGTAIDIVM